MKGKSYPKNDLVETVYSIINEHKRLHAKKKVTTRLLEEEIGSKYKVRYAIIHLIEVGKIKRTKIIGPDKIEYVYDIVKSK
jgi:ribosomal protein L20A (L18A)